MGQVLSLIQTLIWPIFITVLLILGKKYIKDILNIVKTRITSGDSLKIGPLEIETKMNKLFLKTEDEIDKVEDIAKISKKIADIKFWYVIGETYRRNQEWEDARYSYNRALELDDRYTSAYLALATTNLEESKTINDKTRRSVLIKKSLEFCDRAEHIEATFAPIYFRRAIIKTNSEWFSSKEIEKDLIKAIGLDRSLFPFIAREKAFNHFKKLKWFLNLKRVADEEAN